MAGFTVLCGLKILLNSSCAFQVYLTGNDAEVRPYLRECTSDFSSYFSWTIYIIEGVVLAFGAFLAFETRKVCKHKHTQKCTNDFIHKRIKIHERILLIIHLSMYMCESSTFSKC